MAGPSEQPKDLGELTLSKGRDLVYGLVYWKDPVVSGLVAGAGFFAFYLMAFRGMSSITLMAYIALGHLLVRASYQWVSTQLAEFKIVPKRRVPKVPEVFVTVEELQSYVPAATSLVNSCLHAAFKLVYGEPHPTVFKTAAALYVVSLAAKLFGSTGLLFLVFTGAFTLPKLYEQKQPEIDQLLAKIADVSETLFDQALVKAGEAKVALLAKVDTLKANKAKSA